MSRSLVVIGNGMVGHRVVTTGTGHRIGYDALVLATGSRPFVPPSGVRSRSGCFVYRTLDDLDAIREAVSTASTGVIGWRVATPSATSLPGSPE